MNEDRIDELLEEALGVDPSRWGEYLDTHCEDPLLRREVESLLAVHAAHPDSLRLPEIRPSAVPERLGPYRVLRELARGGMGTVYEAEDERLRRRIAIKVLPSRLADDRNWRERFEKEAQHLAALNHPNIATIHSQEESEGRLFLTMELLEGETLSHHLRAKPLSTVDAFEICRQVALALEAIHARGLAHCDLKPLNISVSRSGRVKILDFGLARSKVVAGEPPMENAVPAKNSQSILTGTPGYMSPEQIEGLEADHRADIWAFGCILFECLAGQAAFPGSSPRERMRATLEAEPNWSELPEGTPESIRETIEFCLETDREKRLSVVSAARRSIQSELATRRLPEPIDRESDLPPNNLPQSIDSFVGRRDELGQLSAFFADANGPRLITLVGTGGCGKSRLALEVAPDLGRSCPDGIWRIDLSVTLDADRLSNLLASTLGIREAPGQGLLESIRATLAERRVAILFDNCERRLDDLGQLIEGLLAHIPGLRVLATSREPVGVKGEHILRVAPLPLPGNEERSLADLPKNDAVRLFVERAIQTDPDFRLETDPAAVVAVCRGLDGMPLALELAAARTHSLPVAEIAARLDQRFQLLRKARKGEVWRHDALEATIDWSHDLLNEQEKVLFRRLSVFSGGWSLEAAEAICAGSSIEDWSVLDVLSRLAERSMIEIETVASRRVREPRYRMLESMSRYSHDRLEAVRGDRTEGADTTDRQLEALHANYFASLASRAGPNLRGREAERWTSRLLVDESNLRRAIEHFAERQSSDDGLQMIAHLEWFWTNRGLWSEGRAYAEQFLAMSGSTSPSKEKAAVLIALGNWDSYVGKLDSAYTHLEEASRIAESVGEEALVSRAIHNLGGVELHRENYPRATECFREYVERERARGNRHGVGVGLNSLGLIQEREKRFESARAHYEEGLGIFLELQDRQMIAYLRNNLGNLDVLTSRWEEARASFEENLITLEQLDDRWGMAHTLYHLGAVAARLGAVDDAFTRSREALLIYREIGDPGGIWKMLLQLGLFCSSGGNAASGATLISCCSTRGAEEGGLLESHLEEAQQWMDHARATLGEAEFERRAATGRTLSRDEAVEFALQLTPLSS